MKKEGFFLSHTTAIAFTELAIFGIILILQEAITYIELCIKMRILVE